MEKEHAQDWDHRHTFAKPYCGLSLVGVRPMAKWLLLEEDVVEPHPTHISR